MKKRAKNLNSRRQKNSTTMPLSRFSFACGAYIRVSTEEQASVIEGSLDNQKHRMQSFVDMKNVQEENWGEIVEYYIDDGYSAKDTNRPAYQRMLRDLKKGKINMILVTELSRLSRSIPDFCNLLEDLKDYQGKFLSIKEQFDSSTPAGEMMIYNMINLAQFERKQISERVAINCHSRALRGLNSGASTILGYDKKPDNKATLVVSKTEAEQVKDIFDLFIEHRSLAKTIPHLHTKLIRPKVSSNKRNRLALEGRWTSDSLGYLIQNPAYIGMKEVNKCKKNEEQHQLKPWQRYSVVKASWPAIISEATFKEAQHILEENRSQERARLKNGEKRVFLLSGILKCGECGRALVGHSAHGKNHVHRYYVHTSKKGDVIDCTLKRIRAEELETGLENHLSEILLRAGHSEKIEERIRTLSLAKPEDLKAKKQEIQKQIDKLQKDIDEVFRMQTGFGLESEGIKLVSEKLETLGQKKLALLAELENLKARENDKEDIENAIIDLKDRLESFARGWSKASTGMKKGLLRNLLESLVTIPTGLRVTYRLAYQGSGNMTGSHDINGCDSQTTVTNIADYKHEKELKQATAPKENGAGEILQVEGNGRGCRARTDDIHLVRVALYQVSNSDFLQC